MIRRSAYHLLDHAWEIKTGIVVGTLIGLRASRHWGRRRTMFIVGRLVVDQITACVSHSASRLEHSARHGVGYETAALPLSYAGEAKRPCDGAREQYSEVTGAGAVVPPHAEC